MISTSTASAASPEIPLALKSLTDVQLLSRFFGDREDAAFNALVERHGPLVLSVCRRVLRDATDAQDAFQATFLVLVQKGKGLKQPERLANWLYGVALRTSRKAKARAALRGKSELVNSAMPAASDVERAPIDGMTFEELRGILDEEIARLPTKYALPLVLCYLEGKTNAEAAAQLGWPAGSMSRRLSRARELLRSRMAKRGLGLSVALMTAVFAKSTGPVTSQLAACTSELGRRAAQGLPLSGAASPAAAEIAKAVMQGMSGARLAALSTTAVTIAVLITGLLTVISDYGSLSALIGGGTDGRAGSHFTAGSTGAPCGCGANLAIPVVATSAAGGP